MNEEIKPEVIEDVKPEVIEVAADVEEKVQETAQEVQPEEVVESVPEISGEKPEEKSEESPMEEIKATVANYAEKTLAELSVLFENLTESVDRMKRSKEAEAIKSAFYKRLSKEKADAGLGAEVDEPKDLPEDVQPAPAEAPAAEGDEGPFAAIESGFKALYNKFKAERAEFNRQIEAERDANLVKKQAVIEDLKALVEEQGEMKDAFPKFREIQARWREIGPVPQASFRDVNDTYQLYVEKFYDLVQINRDLRDLDFRKNLEAKTEYCEQAEQLAQSEDVVGAFKDLQKLHEQWKELGPVAKEYRDAIWERFRAATGVINRKYQAHFEELKSQQVENLQAKLALCEKVEEIAGREIKSSGEWNTLSKDIETIQAEWRKIGFATRKENQKVYDRFRGACDKFFARKREYYSKFKDSMNENMDKKLAIIEKAEALSASTDWKNTSDELIRLQKEWKEIGAVPRKKSELLWKRFRAACDAFFNERDKQAKPAENDYHANLRAKKALIEEINAYELTGDEEADRAKGREFQQAFAAIGFVPFKEKEAVSNAYREAMKKFPSSYGRPREGRGPARSNAPKAPLTEKDRLMQQYQQLQQEIQTYENNIGFFGLSKGAEALKAQMQEKIDAAKEDLKALMGKIRELASKEEENEA